MSILYNNKSGSTPETILLAGNANTDQILNGTSKNAIANKAVYAALQDKIDKAVQDLVYYYTKSDVYNKAETRALLSTISSLDIKVVNSLPVSDISTTTIYFLKPTGSQNYDEYVYVDNAWVKIGDTGVDLSQYLEIDDFNVAIADYYTKAEIDAKIAGYYTKAEVDALLDTKQDPLTFDNTPTAGSNNPVKSGGIKTALDAKQNTLTFDTSPTSGSTNPVTSSGVYTAVSEVDKMSERRVELSAIVADDPTVVDSSSLAKYVFNHYFANVADHKYAVVNVWVVNRPIDPRHTTCAESMMADYNALTGSTWSFANAVFEKKPYVHMLTLTFTPLTGLAQSRYSSMVRYWNNNSDYWTENMDFQASSKPSLNGIVAQDLASDITLTPLTPALWDICRCDNFIYYPDLNIAFVRITLKTSSGQTLRPNHSRIISISGPFSGKYYYGYIAGDTQRNLTTDDNEQFGLGANFVGNKISITPLTQNTFGAGFSIILFGFVHIS